MPPSLFLPLSSTHLSVLVLIIVTLYSLAFPKFDYLLSRLSSMPLLARLIARLSCFSHISSFTTQQLHWLSFTTRIEFVVLFLLLKSQLGCAPTCKYLCDHIRPPISASSLFRLHSSQSHDLFMPYARTTMAHIRSFASIGPSLWNRLPPPLRSFILPAPLSSSLSRLKSYLFHGTKRHWKRFCLTYTVRIAI